MDEPSSRMSRAERSAERRREITRIASQHITERGFDNLSVNDLADAIGISVGGMYRYISTKTDLLVMVCAGIYEGVREELGDIAVGPEPVQGRLARAIESYLQACQGQESQIAMVYREYRRLPEAVREEYKERELAIADVFADLMRAGIRQGIFRPVDARVVAHDIIFLGHMPAFKGWALRNAIEDGDELRRQQVNIFMNALAADGERCIDQSAT
jgi:AcrR family transcriptional regulator